MVMSISVALAIGGALTGGHNRSSGRSMSNGRCRMAILLSAQTGVVYQIYVPEQPQQPVIDAPKEASHTSRGD